MKTHPTKCPECGRECSHLYEIDAVAPTLLCGRCMWRRELATLALVVAFCMAVIGVAKIFGIL
jgi:hypothetical protein